MDLHRQVLETPLLLLVLEPLFIFKVLQSSGISTTALTFAALGELMQDLHQLQLLQLLHLILFPSVFYNGSGAGTNTNYTVFVTGIGGLMGNIRFLNN